MAQNDDVRRGFEELGRRIARMRVYARKDAAVRRAVVRAARSSYGLSDAEVGRKVLAALNSVPAPTEAEVEAEGLKFANDALRDLI